MSDLQLQNYLLDFSGADWPRLFEKWRWNEELPAEITPRLMNRFGDLFFETTDGQVQGLMLDQGDVFHFADSRAEFIQKLNEPGNADEWLLISLVDQCVKAGLTLQPGECYSFKHPLRIGGEPRPANAFVVSLAERYRFLGDLHEKLKDVPEGAKVEFVFEKPGEKNAGPTE